VWRGQGQQKLCYKSIDEKSLPEKSSFMTFLFQLEIK
jgi:hypothetical protein